MKGLLRYRYTIQRPAALVAVIATAVSVVLAGAGPADAATASKVKTIGTATITPAKGGEVVASNGMALYVWPHTVAHKTTATIKNLGGNKFDFHINGAWHGQVAVYFPHLRSQDAIVHDLGRVFITEGTARHQNWVYVDHLSVFSTIGSIASTKLCITFNKAAFLECVAAKVGKFVDKKVAKEIADKISSSCWTELVAAGVVGGPAGVALASIQGKCVGQAGETHTVPVTPVQAPPVQAPPVQAPPVQAPPASISASRGTYHNGANNLDIAVHNFPTGTFTYQCHDYGSGQGDVVFYSNQVTVTDPNQSSWPGRFCWDVPGYTAYLTMAGYTSNPVSF